jgi:hypothetical protein
MMNLKHRLERLERTLTPADEPESEENIISYVFVSAADGEVISRYTMPPQIPPRGRKAYYPRNYLSGVKR